MSARVFSGSLDHKTIPTALACWFVTYFRIHSFIHECSDNSVFQSVRLTVRDTPVLSKRLNMSSTCVHCCHKILKESTVNHIEGTLDTGWGIKISRFVANRWRRGVSETIRDSGVGDYREMSSIKPSSLFCDDFIWLYCRPVWKYSHGPILSTRLKISCNFFHHPIAASY